MAGIIGESKNELKFMYESDASSSFLVVRCEGETIDFQLRMLENNDIGYIVPVEVAQKDGTCHFFYNITSRIPLSLYLKRYKFGRDDFLRLLLNIFVCINDSAGYLLASSNFVFNAEYMYIDPGTLDIMLIYIPARISDKAAGTLQSFVSDLLMLHINEDGFGSGNLVQRILSEISSETFSINGFIKLINELLYGQGNEKVQLYLPNTEQEICNKIIEENVNSDKKEEKINIKANISKTGTLPFAVFAVLLQILIGAGIYMCRGWLDNAGDDPAITYSAVILIVLSVEVLVFKKLYSLKLLGISTSGQNNEAIGIGTAQDTVNGRMTNGDPTIQDSMNTPTSECTRSRETDLKGSGSDKANTCVDRNTGTVCAKHTCSDSDTERPENRYVAAGDCNAAQPKENAAVLFDDRDAISTQKTELLSKAPNCAYMLKCRDSTNGGHDIIIDKDEFIIGRLAGHVDYVLENKAVGKLHAELIIRNGSCYVKDLNSINGTYINNQRIESNKEIELKNNDSLLFANSEFIFVSGRA